MKLTFDMEKDVKRVLSIGAVSLALIVGMTGTANASDLDDDGRSNSQEQIAAHAPFASDDGDYTDDDDDDSKDHAKAPISGGGGDMSTLRWRWWW